MEAVRARDMSEGQGEEVARVGIIPCLTQPPVGLVFSIAGQPFKVIGYATREEFLAAAEREGLPVQELSRPEALAGNYFLRVLTD